MGAGEQPFILGDKRNMQNLMLVIRVKTLA